MPRTGVPDLGAVWLLASRRYDIPAGQSGIGYSRGRLPMEAVIVGVAVLELVAVELLVPWGRLGAFAGLRYAVLAASAYAVVWILCWLAAERVRPHLVTDEGLALRWGQLAVADIPWTSIAVVRVQRRYSEDETRLTLDVPLHGTDLDIDLSSPVTVRMPFRRRSRAVQGISLGVDDAEAAAAAIRARLVD